MGYKGTLRSIQAEINRGRRAAEQRQRATQRQIVADEKARAARQVSDEKARAAQQVAIEVDSYEASVVALTALHRNVSNDIEWSDLAAAEPPPPPGRLSANEEAARAALAEFKPSMMKKRSEKKRQQLEDAVEAARREDDEAFEEAKALHAEEVEEWRQTTDIATRVTEGDVSAYSEALEMLSPFGDVQDFGTRVEVEYPMPESAVVTLHVQGESVIPRETKKQLQSGKMSVKEMSKSAFYSLYQEHVCSEVIRVGSDLTCLLPLKSVVVTAVTNMLDPATGHLVEQPIVSAAIPAETLRTINLGAVSPPDAMANFVHNMKFKKTAGFEPVTPVDPDTLSGGATP